MKEDQHIEWKEVWRDEYLKWVCGFANAEGGVLVIGRNDAGRAVGMKDATKLLEDIPNKVRDILGIMVDVNLREEDGHDLIEIRVEPHPSPISYKGEYHYRSGATKQELKGAALERFLLRKRGRHWDDVPEPGFRAEDVSATAFDLFKRNAARSGRMDEAVLEDSREAILDNLELRDGSYLRRAACLLFSSRPERFISGAWIKIGFFVTDDDLRYQEEIHGSLFEQVEATLETLRVKFLKAYISYEGIHRVENYLFPLGALREALLNAIIHKDYSSGIPIQISVYEHQIVIWNAGHMPEGWTMEKLLGKHPSKPANPLLAGAFFRAGYIESWGRGIQKIASECRQRGIEPPVYDFSMSGLMLTFRANPAHLVAALGEREAARLLGEQVGGKVGEIAGTTQEAGQTTLKTTPETTLKQKTPVETPVETPVKTPVKTPDRILMVLKAHPAMTLAEVAMTIGKSVSAVERAAAKLVKEEKLRHVGPTKAGHWEILK